MDAGSIRDDPDRGVGGARDHDGPGGADGAASLRVRDPDGGRAQVAGTTVRSLLLAAAALGCAAVAVAAVADGSALVGGPGLTSGPSLELALGLLSTGLLGMAASSDRDEAVAALTETVERVREGEAVDVDTDREGPVGDLAEAVAGLAEDYRECERARERADRVLDAAPVGITVADADAEDVPLVEVNDRFEELTGYDAEECLGRNCRFLQGEATEAEPVAAMREAIEDGEEVTVELRNYRADGTEFWNRVSIAPVADDDGEVTRYVGFQEDVTERVERERELAEHRQYTDDVLDAVDDVFYVLDEDGGVKRWNRALNEVTGYDDAEIESMHATEFFVEADRPAVERGIENIEEAAAIPLEARFLTKDGEQIPYEIVANPLEAPDGERVIAGVGRDISERKERERQLEAIVGNTDDVVYIKDREGRYRLINEAGASYLGREQSEIVGKRDEDLFDAETVTDIRGDDERVLEGESVSREVVRPIDGEDHVFLDDKYPYRDESGDVVGLIGVSHDITDRKEAERRLRERERRLDEYREYTEDILNAVDDVFYVLDGHGRFQRWNDSLAETLGLDDGEIESRYAPEFFPEDVQDRIAEAMGEVFERGEARIEAPLVTSDDERVPYEFMATQVEDPDGDPVLVGIGRDISERKERERELRATKDRIQKFIETSPVGIVATKPDGTVTLWNDAMTEMFGWSEDEVVGEPYPAVPDDADDRGAEVRRRALEGESFSQVELQRVRANGERIDISLSTAPIRDESGEVTEVVGYIEDITERKERERQLARFERAVEASGHAIYMTDVDGEITYVNSAFEETTGYAADEVVGENPSVLRSGEHDEDYYENLWETVRAGEVWEEEIVDRRKDGELYYAEQTIAPVSDGGGDVDRFVAVQTDVTERIERERELERYETVAETASDVILTIDRDSVIRDANPAAADVFGYDPDELVGESLATLMPDRLAAGHFAAIERYLDDGERRVDWDYVEFPGVRADGSEVPLGISFSEYEHGGEQFFAGIIRDVSERVERERELEARSAAMEQTIEGMAILDEAGRYEFANQAHADVYGYDDPAAFLGESWELCYDEAETERLSSEALPALAAEGEWRGEAVGKRADGTTFPQELSLTTLDDGRQICVVRDITERVERERDLERTTDLLTQVQEMADVGGWEVDTSGGERRATWTEEMYRIHDVPPDAEIDLRAILDAYHPDDRERVRQVVETSLEEGTDYEIEARMTEGAEEVAWVRAIGHAVDDSDDPTLFRGSVQDITGQKRRERELQRIKDMLQQAGRIAAVGGWELDLTTDPPEMTWTDELYRIHGVPPDVDVDMETAMEYYHPEDRGVIREYFQRAVEAGESYDMEVRLEPERDSPRWVRAIGEPVREDGEVVRVRGSIQDITEQKERELALGSLHEATRGLIGVETEAEAAELVVETAESVLDVAGVAVYVLDETSNRLTAISCSSAFRELCEDAPSVGAGDADSLLWNTYVTGTPTVFDDTQTVARSQVFGTDVSGGLLVPVGDHGVFVVATRDRAVDQPTRRLAETLVATTEAAFDRLASEATLRERDAELEARNTRLRRQIQINDLIRRIDQSLIQAGSREAIESTVCGRLVESGDVAFAWIGTLDAADERVEPTAWAGAGEEYLDEVSLALGESAPEPAATTARTEKPTVVSNVVDDLKREPWRKAALATEFHSVVSVPLAFEEYFYGVLTVYAGEPEAFGDLEREVFAELGENIAHSINAVETQRALHTDQLVELTLRFDGDDDVLGRLAAQADCRIEYEGLATHSEDETSLFVTAAGAPSDDVAEALDRIVSVREFRLVSERDEEDDGEPSALFEVTVAGDTLPSQFVRHGASPRSISASAEGIEAVLDVPTTTDVRAFVDMLRDTHPSVDLASRRTVERATQSRQALVSSLFDALTDRQLEVLRTAYLAGFFDWPRTSTGEDVAEMLDVSQPTVNRHVRLGQQRLLAQLFEEETPVEAD